LVPDLSLGFGDRLNGREAHYDVGALIDPLHPSTIIINLDGSLIVKYASYREPKSASEFFDRAKLKEQLEPRKCTQIASFAEIFEL
jgi:hypothetical protein